MDYMQYDLFGNLVKPKEKPKPSRKLKTMQELHGTLEGFNCKDCKHCLNIKYHDYSYRKCELWKLSHCSSTDIRLKDTACRKFENKSNEGEK